MNDLQRAGEILNDTIRFKARHSDYERVTKLATEYFNIFTASKIEEYLIKYRKSESDAAFNQALEMYESVTPSVVHNLETIFEKPLRSNRVYTTIEHDSSKAREEILQRIANFWHGETESGLDAYLRERWKRLITFDPNAFLVVEFFDFDPNKEKPQPFAIEYSSSQAINYEFINGRLDWLIVELPIMYKAIEAGKEVFKDGSRFIMYLDEVTVQYTEVDKLQKLTDVQDPEFIEINAEDSEIIERVFVREEFEQKSGGVPAFRVGYLLDPITNNRTCLSNIHYALAFFKKEMKSGVELDLTIRGHVFPQKVMYGPQCPGDKENGQICNSGKTANGTICEMCGGTGTFPVHTSAQDLVVVPLPRPGEESAIDITKAMAYFSPPMDLVKFMEEYSQRLTEKAKGAVFPAQDVLRKATGDKTATEMDYSWDNVYDALRKFTDKYSFAWRFIVGKIAIYTDNAGDSLKLYHAFPSDFKMKPVGVLLEESKKATDSRLPQHIKEAINNDIANIYYADDQDTLKKIQIKNKFHPFTGKAEDEINAILASPDILQYFKVLYIYFDIIFQRIEEQNGDLFYSMEESKQRDLVKAEVDKLIVEINKVKAKSFSTAKDPILEDE